MNEHVYKTIQITGSSHTGPEDAIRLAIEKAAQTVPNVTNRAAPTTEHRDWANGAS
jgi:flavin-binding protein dodecin